MAWRRGWLPLRQPPAAPGWPTPCSPWPPCCAPTRHVRRAAVQVLSTAAHNKPGLVVDHLPAALPLLYQQTIVSSGQGICLALASVEPQNHNGACRHRISCMPVAGVSCALGPGLTASRLV